MSSGFCPMQTWSKNVELWCLRAVDIWCPVTILFITKVFSFAKKNAIHLQLNFSNSEKRLLVKRVNLFLRHYIF